MDRNNHSISSSNGVVGGGGDQKREEAGVTTATTTTSSSSEGGQTGLVGSCSRDMEKGKSDNSISRVNCSSSSSAGGLEMQGGR